MSFMLGNCLDVSISLNYVDFASQENRQRFVGRYR